MEQTKNKPSLVDRLTNNGKWEFKRIGLFNYIITTKSKTEYGVCLTQLKDLQGLYVHGTLVSGTKIIDINKQNPEFPDLEPFEMFVTGGNTLDKALGIIKSLEHE